MSEETLGKMIGCTYSFQSAATEREKVWDKLHGYLATGQYTLITEFIDKIQTPDQDLQMMYHFLKYHIYGQAGDDRKALESLYRIPKDYKGRNENLINYYKYLNDFYKDECPFSFNDYVALYRKNLYKGTQDKSRIRRGKVNRNRYKFLSFVKRIFQPRQHRFL